MYFSNGVDHEGDQTVLPNLDARILIWKYRISLPEQDLLLDLCRFPKAPTRRKACHRTLVQVMPLLMVCPKDERYGTVDHLASGNVDSRAPSVSQPFEEVCLPGACRV